MIISHNESSCQNDFRSNWFNYIFFSTENFKYIVYDTYYAKDKESNVGIKVKNLKTNGTTALKASINLKKGP